MKKKWSDIGFTMMCAFFYMSFTVIWSRFMNLMEFYFDLGYIISYHSDNLTL